MSKSKFFEISKHFRGEGGELIFLKKIRSMKKVHSLFYKVIGWGRQVSSTLKSSKVIIEGFSLFTLTVSRKIAISRERWSFST